MSIEQENICILSFYNMHAKMIVNGRIREENLAVRNVVKKNNSVFLDVYFYSSKKSKMLDFSYISSLLDLSTEKYYEDKDVFYEDYKAEQSRRKKEVTVSKKKEDTVRCLDEIRDMLVILYFIGHRNPRSLEIKGQVVKDFISRYKPAAKNLSITFIKSYLDNQHIDEEEFYKCLENLKKYEIEDIKDLLKELAKVCVLDGSIDYEEKIYLAEILQTLREYGIEF